MNPLVDARPDDDLDQFLQEFWDERPRPEPESEVLNGEVDELLRNLDAEISASKPEIEGPEDPLDELRGIVPEEAITFVHEIARTQEVALQVLLGVHAHICRRLPSDSDHREAAKQRWSLAWENRSAAVQRRVKRKLHEVVRVAHNGSTYEETRPSALPKKYIKWRPDSEGRIHVSDPKTPKADLGNAAYLERTPVEVIRFSHRSWEESHSTQRMNAPVVWDITSGSCTADDYFHTLGSGECINSDIVIARDDVTLAPANHAGRINRLGSREREAGRRRPDLVFFDPPSMGGPTHSEIYDGSRSRLDLALLDCETWISEVGDIARRCVAHLAPEGLLSLTVRAGRRRDQSIKNEPLIVDALKVFLREPILHLPKVEIYAEHEVSYSGHRCNQASLGTARVPTTHILLRSPS